jgi:endonuclease/exonuclease/phosphatase family metal-dependent hydrolase
MKMKNYIISILTMLLLSTTFINSQEIVKIATYNLLNYPNNTATKNPKFQLIMNDMNPDILVVQEIISQSAVNQFLNQILNSEYEAGDFINGPDTDNAIFFKDSLFQFISTEIIAPSQGPRYIGVFKLFHKFTLDTLIIYSAHFKASQGTDNEQIRLNEAATLRVLTNLLPQGTDFILVGDLNLYRSTEPAYERLLLQDGTGYFLDPINRSGVWHSNAGFADIHTQSTRIPDLGDGGSTGGLDDRFDFILTSQSIIDQGGIDYIDGSYCAYGNDGLHFNLSIHDPPNQSVSTDIAIALYIASDHLPVLAEFNFGVVSAVEDEIIQPDEFILYQNYPNPFNPSTIIKYTIPDHSRNENTLVVLKVYDVLGNEVAVLVNEEKPAGTYEVEFSAKGGSASGGDVYTIPSGVYIYRLTSGNFSSSKKLIILK